MNPTLEGMKLAVAQMLPDVLRAEDAGNDVVTGGIFIEWLDTDEAVSEKEWLHVCWLAAESVKETDFMKNGWHFDLSHHGKEFMVTALHFWMDGDQEGIVQTKAETPEIAMLEALCRVKHPEMFQQHSP